MPPRKKRAQKLPPKRRCTECGEERQAPGGKGLRFFRRGALSVCDKCHG